MAILEKDTRRQFGDRGEGLAVALLERAGYEILERNVSCRYGEIDIIAVKDTVHCFVEVRSRATDVWGVPAESVIFAKQRKVVKASIWWLQRQRLLERVPVRFDVVSVVGRGPDARVEHLPGAFDAGF
ncbi:MAG: Endonuclease [Myxococcaceae bacterium]|nr:Endonuclease [Myxococcaceae bacterium]